MPNIELIAELQAIQTGGTSGFKGLSSVSPKARLILRKSQAVLYPAMQSKSLDNNITAIALYGVQQLQANYW